MEEEAVVVGARPPIPVSIASMIGSSGRYCGHCINCAASPTVTNCACHSRSASHAVGMCLRQAAASDDSGSFSSKKSDSAVRSERSFGWPFFETMCHAKNQLPAYGRYAYRKGTRDGHSWPTSGTTRSARARPAARAGWTPSSGHAKVWWPKKQTDAYMQKRFHSCTLANGRWREMKV